MSQDGKRNSDSIASKLIQGGFPSDLDFLQFNAALNQWIFTASGGGAVLSNQRIEVTVDETTTSVTFVNSTLTLTLATRAAGNFMASCEIQCNISGFQGIANFRFVEGATNINGIAVQNSTSANHRDNAALFLAGDLDGDVITIQMRVNAGTLTLRGTAADEISHLVIYETS